MAFKKRKADRRKLEAPIFSGAAEVCETRALLSADGVCLPAVDADAVVIEDIEATESEEVIELDATVEDGEFIPELAICTMMVPEFLDGVEVFEEEVAGEEGEVLVDEELVDPSLMFYSFMTCEGGDAEVVDGEEVAVCDIVVDDGSVIDEEPVFKGHGEEEVVVNEEFVDVTTLEDYDPSWAYRTFVTGGPDEYTEIDEEVVEGEETLEVVDEEVVEEEYFDITTMEDYDPSWAYRGTIVDGEKVLDEEEVVVEEGEVVDDDEVVVDEGEITEEEEEIVYLEDGGEVPVRYYFGMNFRGNTGGELPVEILAMTSGGPAPESAPSVMGPVAVSTPVAAPVVSIPVVVNQPASLPVVVTPTLAIPVNNGGFAPLFVEEEELLVTTLASVVSEIEPLVSEVEDTVSSGLGSEFGALIGPRSDSSDAPADELTPIFEDAKDEENSVEVPTAEEAPVETEEPVSSVEVPRQPVVVASRVNHGRSIDEFMSEFAMSGFAG